MPPIPANSPTISIVPPHPIPHQYLELFAEFNDYVLGPIDNSGSWGSTRNARLDRAGVRVVRPILTLMSQELRTPTMIRSRITSRFVWATSCFFATQIVSKASAGSAGLWKMLLIRPSVDARSAAVQRCTKDCGHLATSVSMAMYSIAQQRLRAALRRSEHTS